MRFPDLLTTRRGRLAAFFFLYVAEGIPSGFTGTAIATQMRRQDLDPAVIGSFIGALYLPWGIKWAYGPIVDVISSERWGRRRAWIIATQFLMIATLVAAIPIDWKTQLGVFTALMFLNNVFAATQDVAIDALAVNVLHTDEKGLANGLMFGGQYLGMGMGGSGDARSRLRHRPRRTDLLASDGRDTNRGCEVATAHRAITTVRVCERFPTARRAK